VIFERNVAFWDAQGRDGAVSGSSGSARNIVMLAWLAAPDRGSEWAAGWGMARAAARLGRVFLLVRPDCAPAIRDFAAARPDLPIEAVPVESPPGLHRTAAPHLPKAYFLDYLAWLRAAREAARAIAARTRIDLAVHAALGCYWLPSPVVELGAPSVWGPVGGATRTPPALLSVLGARGLFERAVERAILGVAGRLPATRRTMRRADLVLVECRANLAVLPRDVAARARIFNRAVLTEVPAVPPRERGRFVLFPSTLHARKGPMLALEALRQAPPGTELVFANEGPEEPRLRRKVVELGLEGRVRFLGRVPRQRCFELVREAGCVLFAGTNEDGGCALVEAMLLGAPVVVLGHSGPAEIVERWGTDPSRALLVRPAAPSQVAAEMGEAIGRLLARPPRARDPHLDQAGAVLAFTGLLEAAMAPAPAERIEPEPLPARPAEPVLPSL
jgi:glycosyltransferase involved in cell wall biosynthesis